MLYEIQSRLLDYEWQGTGTKCPLLDEKEGCVMKGSIPFSCAKSNCGANGGWSKNCTEQLISTDIIIEVV